MKKYLPLLLVSLLTLPMATYAAPDEFYTPIPASGVVTGQLDWDGSADGSSFGDYGSNVKVKNTDSYGSNVAGKTFNGGAGQFQGYFSVGDTLLENSDNPANLFFRFFCIDLYQPTTSAVPDYVASRYSNSNSTMQKLYDIAYPNEALGDFFNGTSKTNFGAFSTIGTYSAIEYSTAFQLAVWELVYENSGSFSLNSGNFTDATTGDAHKIANDWLSQVTNYTGTNYQNWQLYGFANNGNQDFVSARFVPEPGTLLLAGLGLAGLAMTSRRRRNQV